MIKKRFALFAFLILLTSFVLSASIASSQEFYCEDAGDCDPGEVCVDNVCVTGGGLAVEGGSTTIGAMIQETFGFTGETNTLIAWFFLALVIFLVYASLSYGEFPKNPGLRWIIAIIVGFLATMLLTRTQIVTIMQSYTALGATMILFLPIVILALFTLVVSSKVSPFGILIQRIAWLIYSVLLFIRTGTLLLVKVTGIESLAGNKTIAAILGFIGGDNLAADTTILAILFIASIFIFVVFVVMNQGLTRWLAHERREADVEKFKDTANRAKSVEDIRADATR